MCWPKINDIQKSSEIHQKVSKQRQILFQISDHVMYSAIAPTPSVLIFVPAERVTQETAINAQI